MKKLFAGFLFIVAVAGTGCLGEANQEILGNWIYNTTANPASHSVSWTFNDDGKLFICNNTTSECDTGTYELFMNGTHRMFRVAGISIGDHTMPLAGEWYIVKLNYEAMIIGTKDYGGFQQRDLQR